MYSINSIPLDNPALRWEMLAPSLPLSAMQMEVTRTKQAGRDGVIAAPPSRGPVTLKFTVRTPYEHLSTLLSLFTEHSLEVRELAKPERVARGLLVSSTPELHFPHADLYSHSFLIEIPEGCWRGPTTTSALVEAVPAGAVGDVFAGLSAPVQDSIVRFKGPLSTPQLMDSSGAWLAVDGNIPAGHYVRFESASGRAWETDTDTWQGGNEVSGQVDDGGPRDLFEITPLRISGAPTERAGRLTLTHAGYTAGAGFQVRGAPAFLL